MKPRFRATLFAAVAATFTITSASAQQAKVPLDHSVYDGWSRISARAISNDGQWVLYRVSPNLGDSDVYVRNIRSGQEIAIPRGNSAAFSEDSRFVVFQIQPQDSIVKDLRLKDTRPANLPKDSLGILNLASGDIVRVERVKSFALPEESGEWLAYLHEAPRPAPRDSMEGGSGRSRGAGDDQGPQRPRQAGGNGNDKAEGTQLVVRNLASGAEWQYEDVTAYAFAETGGHLAYAASNDSGDVDGVYLVTPGTEAAQPLMMGEGVYKGLALDDDGNQVAFLSNRDEFEEDQPAFTLYHWRSGRDEARAVADASTRGVPPGWWVSEHGTPSFSEDGERLFFGTAPRPEPDPEEETPEWEKVELDVWNWKDPLLQPNQLVQRQRELERTYEAMVDLGDNRVVQLATIDLPTVTVSDSGRGDIGLAVTNMPYRQRISWDSPGYNDVYVVDVNTGRPRMVLEEIQASASLSPGGKYITWWDGHERAWFAMDVDGGDPVNLTGGIGLPFYDELDDHPSIPGSNGSAGWTEDDERFLVYDSYDLWAVDPTGRDAPRNVTEGVGRREHLRFQYVNLDRAGGFGFGRGGGSVIDDGEDILLSAFDMTTKASGFYRDRVRGNREPQRILMEPYRFGSPQKAEDADVVIFTRESFQEFPDLWASDLNFRNPQRLSRANPQQDDYLWGTAELTEWTSTDGMPLQGLLFKPENFDPNRQYPMMVYYYEKNSDQLHAHRTPSPGSSSIDISFYVSRGYVVFIPDVYYRDGYPGESALHCVVPGVLSLIAKGFVDPDRIGAQGHSWGGYQNAYLVTRTNIFAAVEAGAPVSNMVSAYGGIRWQTGLSRAMQYERTQSRLGGSLWEVQPRYIENSPIFWADKVETPLLMMHNDNDGAVPWYQGIEFFVGLRRLHKPVWMLNYNGEPHGLRKYQNRKDFAVRMQQFFDHYLMGAPAPEWMEFGVPAVKKGKDLGLKLVTEATTSGGNGR